MEDKIFKLNEDYEINEIKVNLGLTINLGNYEFARIDQGSSVKLLKQFSQDEIKLLYKQLQLDLLKQVRKEAKRIYNMPVINVDEK